MKIEIAVPGRMTQSGSSLLKLIQNNNMPILDLLVRESIQNSLDAGNLKNTYVEVNFLTGKFESVQLNEELEGITDALNRKYIPHSYKYIAIRDSKTVGLTGKLHYDEVTDNQYGNLLKLIYEISKPQEAEGAGGSWGLGKTVYFRVGIGLVIYYSRILNEEGKYESRLAASLVEDEMQEDSLIPRLDGKSKRGIAWWGETIGNNKSRPITDKEYIAKILKIFNIDPYENEDTGTTVIIPYINEQKLLSNNQIEYKDGENQMILPFWRKSIEDYLTISIQRWYIPRLNNNHYPYGKFLKAKVNNKSIDFDNMEPVFKVVQALYNRAIGAEVTHDILCDSSIDSKIEKILLRKTLQDTHAGTVSFAKVPRIILKTSFPDNKPEPYMYFNCEIRNKEKNKPVICFTRKPGMIVSYEDVGNWVDGINSLNSDEFIFGIFVLNSKNELSDTEKGHSLEEYIRKSEMADHTSWSDFSLGTFNPRIVSRIQQQVNNKIAKEFFLEEESNTSKLNSGLGKMFGDLLLPPENFGKKPSLGPGIQPISGTHIDKHKTIIVSYNPVTTKYYPNEMEISFDIKSRNEIDFMKLNLAIDSEMGKISVEDWEYKMGMKMPFEIEECNLIIKKIDKKTEEIKMNISKEKILDDQGEMNLKLKTSAKDAGIGIHFYMNEKYKIEMEMIVRLSLYRKDLKPLFVVDEKEGDK